MRLTFIGLEKLYDIRMIQFEHYVDLFLKNFFCLFCKIYFVDNFDCNFMLWVLFVVTSEHFSVGSFATFLPYLILQLKLFIAALHRDICRFQLNLLQIEMLLCMRASDTHLLERPPPSQRVSWFLNHN